MQKRNLLEECAQRAFGTGAVDIPDPAESIREEEIGHSAAEV